MRESLLAPNRAAGSSRRNSRACPQSDIKNEETAGDALLRFARLRMAGVPVQLRRRRSCSGLARDWHRARSTKRSREATSGQQLIDDKSRCQEVRARRTDEGRRVLRLPVLLPDPLAQGPRGRPRRPRRNLAEFLDEYLVRFKDGDKWLYRVPDAAEAEALRKSRQTGLGRRIRQYVAFLRGEGDFPRERRPDAKTLFAWLKHCANFGLADEGVCLFEKGGMAGLLGQLPEEDRYDAEDYYAQCRRKARSRRPRKRAKAATLTRAKMKRTNSMAFSIAHRTSGADEEIGGGT